MPRIQFLRYSGLKDHIQAILYLKKKKEENIFSSHRISSTQKRTHTAKGAYLEAHDLSSLYNPARQLDPD